MITKLFVIYDAKAKFYNKPFNLPNEATALRTFTDLTNDPNTDICKHPEDFTLFEIGSYDDEHAKLTPLTIPNPICSALSVKVEQPITPLKKDK